MAIPSIVASGIRPWSIEYQYDVTPNNTRTSQRGFRRQASGGNRHIMLANATRQLQLIELPYFEYFVREVCKEGSLKFTDAYADYNGLTTGTIRIVDGSYSVQTDTRRHTVTCQIEVFR